MNLQVTFPSVQSPAKCRREEGWPGMEFALDFRGLWFCVSCNWGVSSLDTEGTYSDLLHPVSLHSWLCLVYAGHNLTVLRPLLLARRWYTVYRLPSLLSFIRLISFDWDMAGSVPLSTLIDFSEVAPEPSIVVSYPLWQLYASFLSLCTVSLCVSPAGALVVCLSSGSNWGAEEGIVLSTAVSDLMQAPLDTEHVNRLQRLSEKCG